MMKGVQAGGSLRRGGRAMTITNHPRVFGAVPQGLWRLLLVAAAYLVISAALVHG
jgi:hypothetical protein